MKTETKVGLLFVGTIILVAMFMTWLGVIDPLRKTHTVHVLYNFAGGINPGSPVRVMGIKVGKVWDIDFVSGMKAQNGEEGKLKITISIDDKAWDSLREDSRFYINIAGVVGEKYIEITPGSTNIHRLQDNGVYRGIDPPRLETLISQSFNLAGKILDLVEKNEDKIGEMIDTSNHLIANFNRTLIMLDRMSEPGKMMKLIDNLTVITENLRNMSSKINSADAEKSIEIINRLLEKLDKIDEKTIRKFLQEDGIKAKLF